MACGGPAASLQVSSEGLEQGANVSGTPWDQMPACTENMQRRERLAEEDNTKRFILKEIEERGAEVKDLMDLEGGNR